jgi:Electron transfer DM13
MRAPGGNVELAAGSFEDARHAGSGRAAVVRLGGGERKLTLTDFDVSNGPDLFVYLAAGSPTEDDQVDDYVDLGGLKGNKGNQQYTIPADADTRRYSTVVIWCRAFTVLFARAELRPS